MSELYSFELITVWRGRDSATYLCKDFVELGDKATPIRVSQYPGINQPFNKIELKDVDGFYGHNAIKGRDIKQESGTWDMGILKQLMEDK